MSETKYKRLFILNARGIGDLVMSLPLLHALRKQLPDSHINLGVSSAQSSLARTLEGTVADELTVQIHQNKLRDRLYFAKSIRQFKPDLLADLFGGSRYFLAGYFSSGRVIYASVDDTRPILSIIPVERLAVTDSPHLVDRHLQLLNRLRLSVDEISFDFPIDEETLEKADGLVRQYDLRGRKLVALIPEAGQPFKAWPLETLRGTIDALANDFGYNVVVFGKNASDNLSDKPVLDLRGKTELMVDAFLLKYSGLFDVVIGADTGMMHIAGAVSSDPDGSYAYNTLGNPTISLFGPSDPRKYKPYDPTGRFNMLVQPSMPAFRRDCFGYATDRHNRPYMREITVPMIIEKVERQLEQHRAA